MLSNLFLREMKEMVPREAIILSGLMSVTKDTGYVLISNLFEIKRGIGEVNIFFYVFDINKKKVLPAKININNSIIDFNVREKIQKKMTS